MIDRDKVIKGMECCLDYDPDNITCPECPYDDSYKLYTTTRWCIGQLIEDALSLLREQEPQKPHYCEADDSWSCGNCGETVGYGEYNSFGPVRNKYCKECGRKVKWNA